MVKYENLRFRTIDAEPWTQNHGLRRYSGPKQEDL